MRKFMPFDLLRCEVIVIHTYIYQFFLFYCHTATNLLKVPVYRGSQRWQMLFYLHLTVTILRHIKKHATFEC